MTLQAPVEIEMKVYLTSEDLNAEAVATIGMGKGTLPTEEDLRNRLNIFESEEMPDGFRLSKKVEFFDRITSEAGYSETFACPGGKNWDK